MAKVTNAYQLVNAILRGIRWQIFFGAHVVVALQAVAVVILYTLYVGPAWIPDIMIEGDKSFVGFLRFVGILGWRASGVALAFVMLSFLFDGGGLKARVATRRRRVLARPYVQIKRLRLMGGLLPDGAMSAIKLAAQTRVVTNHDVWINLREHRDGTVGSLHMQQKAALFNETVP